MTTVAERQTPSNVEAEQAVLGSILLDAPAYLSVANNLRPADFFLEKHQWIYEAIGQLHRKSEPIDFLTVATQLDNNSRLNLVGGAAYLTSLLSSVPSASHIQFYAEKVNETSARRQLIQVATEIAEDAYDKEKDISVVKNDSAQRLNRLSVGRTGFVSVEELVNRDRERISNALIHPREVTGIPSGFPQIDRLLGGWQIEGYYVISGNSSVGKTFFLLTILLNLAYAGHGSGLVSLEMSGKQLKNRLLGMIAGIPSTFFERGLVEEEIVKNGETEKRWRRFTEYEMGEIEKAQNKLASLPIYINESAVRNATQMRTEFLNLVALHPDVEVGALDYLQLMGGEKDGGKKGATRNDELGGESRELKLLAKQFPIIALSQKNRDNERRDNRKSFKMADLRDSGAIAQDADIIFDLYNQDYVDAQEGKTIDKPTNLVEALVAKDRLSNATGKRIKFNLHPLTRYYKDATIKEGY